MRFTGSTIAVALLALALAGLALPAAASAHKTRHTKPAAHPTTDPVALALERAEDYWHTKPCHGAIAVISTPEAAMPKSEDIAVLAYTSFDTPAGPDLLTEPPATYTDCAVRYDAEEWPTWQILDLNFANFCQMVTHELGHLEGIGDPGTPGTVTQTDALTAPIVAPCLHLVLWYGHERLVG